MAQMKEYLFVTGRNLGNDVTVLKIKDSSYVDALVKFYKYFGGTVSYDIFKNAVTGSGEMGRFEESIKYFEQTTREGVIYFGIVHEKPFVDYVTIVDCE